MPGFDVIGDIHGHADALIPLLRAMDYRERDGIYRHASRTAIFLGDFVDRGPSQREVLLIGRAMVEAGAARAVMGNHEFNAIAYAKLDNRGEFLRPHTRRTKPSTAPSSTRSVTVRSPMPKPSPGSRLCLFGSTLLDYG